MISIAHNTDPGLRVSSEHLNRVTKMLLSFRSKPEMYWGWLNDRKGKRLDKMSANKFLLASILDYQIPA